MEHHVLGGPALGRGVRLLESLVAGPPRTSARRRTHPGLLLGQQPIHSITTALRRRRPGRNSKTRPRSRPRRRGGRPSRRACARSLRCFSRRASAAASSSSSRSVSVTQRSTLRPATCQRPPSSRDTVNLGRPGRRTTCGAPRHLMLLPPPSRAGPAAPAAHRSPRPSRPIRSGHRAANPRRCGRRVVHEVDLRPHDQGRALRERRGRRRPAPAGAVARSCGGVLT